MIANSIPTSPPFSLSDNAWEWLSNLTLTPKGLFLSQILEKPTIFISCLRSAADEQLLRDHQITHVFSFAPQPNEDVIWNDSGSKPLTRHQTNSPNSIYAQLQIQRYLFLLKDENTNSDFDLKTAFEAFEDLCRENPAGKILIHCELGASRSISFVAALIAKSKDWSFKSAVMEIRKHREVGIDSGFAVQLCQVLGIRCE